MSTQVIVNVTDQDPSDKLDHGGFSGTAASLKADLDAKIVLLNNAISAIENGEAGRVFANLAAATAYYNDVNTVPKPDNGLPIYLKDVKQIYEWDSDHIDKATFVRDIDLTQAAQAIADAAAAQNTANTAIADAAAAQTTANTAIQNAQTAQNKANGNEQKIGELGDLETGEDSSVVDAVNEVNSKAMVSKNQADQANQNIGNVGDLNEGTVVDEILFLKDETSSNAQAINRNDQILRFGSDAYTHAKRVHDDNGTTTDLTALDEYIRKFRDWNLALFPHAKKVAKLYAQLPTDGNGDAEITRTTPCDTIDKNGNNVLVSANEPRLDYRDKHVEETDESYYEFKNEHNYLMYLSNASVGNISKGDVYVYAYVNITEYPSVGMVARIAGKGQTSAGAYGLHITSDGKIYAGVRNGAVNNEVVFSQNPIPLNQWVFLEYVRDSGNEGLLYIDGVLDNSHNDNGLVIQDNTYPFSVSGNYILGGNAELLKAKVNRVGMWNVIPTAQEREDNKNGLPVPEKYKNSNGFDKAGGIQNDDSFTLDTFNDNGNGSYTCANTGTSWQGFEQIKAAFPVRKDEVYRLSFDYTLNSGENDLQLFIGNGAVGSNYGNNILTANAGYNEIDFTINSDQTAARLVSQINKVSNFTISNIKLVKLGSVINLSIGKSNYGNEVVINGNFKTDSDWNKGVGCHISGGQAIFDGTQTSGTNMNQENAGIIIGETYKVTYTISSISAGTFTMFVGSTSNGAIRSTAGTFTDYIRATGIPRIYLEGNVDFIGAIEIVSIKKASNWFDLDHNIKSAVNAPLKRYNGFGGVIHGVRLTPSFCSEGGNVINHFLNSGTPVDQTITGLTIGKIYTFNFGGKGIALIEQIGVDAGGAATELYHHTFIAKSTSIDITFIGIGAKWANLTDSKIPYNHIPTQSTSVTKDADILKISNLQANNLVGTNEGAWYIEFDENSNVSERSSGQDMLMLTPSLTTPYLSSLGFWTKGDDKIQIRAFNDSDLLGVVNSNTKLAGSKVLMTWRSDTIFVSANGEEIGVMEDVPMQAFDFIYNRQQQDTKFGIKTIALTDKFINKTERIKRTTL